MTPPLLSRRRVLALGGLTAASTLAVLGTASRTGLPDLTRDDPPATTGQPLAAPPDLRVRRRESGLVEADLTASLAPVRVAGLRVRTLAYGGSVPGPTLRLREGDTVRLRFHNRTPEHTSLHLHGLPLPPEVDDPFGHLMPGESRLLEFTVPAGSAGTAWYHPHAHGSVARQLFAGLAGAVVVQGPADAEPGLRDADDHLLVLKDLAVSGGRVTPHTFLDMQGRHGALKLVNGQHRPVLTARRGLLRLRLVNASTARPYRLAFDDLPLHLIATDGGLVERPVALRELLLAPGERAEVLVRPSAPGTYPLRLLPYDNGVAAHTEPETLLTLRVPPGLRAAPLPGTLATVERLDLRTAAVRREVVFDTSFPLRHRVNGRSFDATRADFTGRLGTLEVWELVNRHAFDHPFHLHSYPFQVIERNGTPEPFRAWRDVVNLRSNDRVRIAVPLRRHAGRTVFHCHVAEHEDRGMMGVLDVRA